MDSRDGSRGNTMNSNSVSNIRNSITNSMVDWGSIADSTMNRGSITDTITKTSIAISTIQSLWFSFSLTLGNMDGTSRVCNISSCSSISSMDGRNGSRGNTMDSNSVSNIRNSITNSMVNRGSITHRMVDRCCITNRVVDWGSIADSMVDRSRISKMSVSTVISISLSGSKGSTTNQKDSLDHVDLVTKHW